MLRSTKSLFGLLIIAFTGMASAVETTPFTQKFERQKADNYDGKHVFQPGERVRAPFIGTCEGLLTKLTVAERAKGGVGDIRHADSFDIVDSSASNLDKVRDWRGMTFEGVVEIIEPIQQGFIISNMFPYRARIVELNPPTSVINPDNYTVDKMKNGEEAILLGQVVELTEKSVTIQAVKRGYKVELWSGVPLLDADLSGLINNLSRKDRLQIGDEVQLKVYKKEEGGLGTHWCRSCNLYYPSDDRLEKYKTERARARAALGDMAKAIREGRPRDFRAASARLYKLQLTSGEVGRHRRLWNMIPAEERPLLVEIKSRYEIEALNEMFGVDFDAMTVAEVVDFARRWARMEVSALPKKEKGSSDQSYLFRVLEEIEDGNNLIHEIARTSIRTRLDYFKALSNEGTVYQQNIHWSESYNLDRSLAYFSTSPMTPQTFSFAFDVLLEIAKLEQSGWGFENKFLYEAVNGIEHLFEDVVAGRSALWTAARRAFKAQVPKLREAYEALLTIPREGPRGQVVIIGLPRGTRQRSTLPFENLKHNAKAAKLYNILEISETW